MNRRTALLSCAIALPWVLLLCAIGVYLGGRKAVPEETSQLVPASVHASRPPNQLSRTEPTQVYAHNLMLRKGPSFRVYVRWLHGELARTRRNEDPSFDDIDSFYLNIQTGVLRANMGDIGDFLNAGALANSPLQQVTLRGDGDQIKLTGTVHKLFTLPVEMDGTIGAVPDGRIRIHVTSLKLLKIPLKGLLSRFKVTLSDLIKPGNLPGLEISGSDIYLDTQQLLPPPHIRGELKSVRVVNPDLELIYGDAAKEVEQVEEWRNFLRLSGGRLDFGKLTMNHVDLIMIDISKDAWFDLDMANYQQQLVHGYTRMTPQAGLQIFMPDVRDLPHDQEAHKISIEWFKNRNLAPPPDVRGRQGGQ